MAAEETADDQTRAMVVDVLVQITRAPTWNQPVGEFTKTKCVAFDNFEEENKHEYSQIHNEFRELVDSLLTAHLLEVDMDPDQFEKDIESSNVAEDPRFKNFISQLMAAEDFLLFKQMMVDRHLALQTEAESAIKEASGAQDRAAVAEEVAAVAAALEADEAAAAASAAASGAAADASAETGGQAASPAPVKAPTAEEERAFGAAGGVYGRASLPSGGKKQASSDKAASIRKAICTSAKPR
mmetsp:Transcript_19716/g.38638  ORF Transcript_19716/g.38638 Transcript_19716/m.38638 type:complete len:241 (-) Transcript_19716:142-864(-)